MTSSVHYIDFNLSPCLPKEANKIYAILSYLDWFAELSVTVDGFEWTRENAKAKLYELNPEEQTIVPLIVEIATYITEQRILSEHVDTLRKHINSTESISEWESNWVKALLALADDDLYSFKSHLENHLAVFNSDVLTAVVLFFMNFYSGDSFGLKSTLSALHLKDHYLSMCDAYLGFSMIELGQLDEAEPLLLKSRSSLPDNGWVIHAWIHFLDYYGRTHEGITYLRKMEPVLSKSAMRCHNQWHWALFEITAGDHGSAMLRYEEQIANSGSLRFLIDDSASLLMTLEIEGYSPTQNFWNMFEDDVKRFCNSHPFIFHDFHLWLACFKIGDQSLISQAIDSTTDFSTISSIYKRHGVSLCKALLAFIKNDIATASDLLFSLKGFINQGYGGSVAQRQIFWKLLCKSLSLSNRKVDQLRLMKVQSEIKLMYPHSASFKKQLELNHFKVC